VIYSGRFEIKSLPDEKFIPSGSFYYRKISNGFTSFISSKTASINSNCRFYQKWIRSVVILCQMIAEYFSRRLADLGSVSYILVGIKVVVKKHGTRSFNTGAI
jgi:hypothetical protein